MLPPPTPTLSPGRAPAEGHTSGNGNCPGHSGRWFTSSPPSTRRSGAACSSANRPTSRLRGSDRVLLTNRSSTMKPTTLRLIRLETRLAPAVATWDGGGADNHWTTAANWVGDVAPHAGDDLVFPAGAAQLATVNDFPDGTAFHSLMVNSVGNQSYQLSGNRIALAAGLSVQGNAIDQLLIGLPITLSVRTACRAPSTSAATP